MYAYLCILWYQKDGPGKLQYHSISFDELDVLQLSEEEV